MPGGGDGEKVSGEMIKLTKMLAVLAVMAVLASAGGCVMKSTHDKVVAKLGLTEAELQQSQADNARLKSGLGALADGAVATAGKVETMGASVAKLQADGSNVAMRLSQLQAVVTAHVAALAELTAAMGPLKEEIEALRAKSAALAGRAEVAKATPAVSTGEAVSAAP